MNPYRAAGSSTKEAIARPPRDIALSALVFAVGALGVAIGISQHRSFEAGAGTSLAIFGAAAIARALARRR